MAEAAEGWAAQAGALWRGLGRTLRTGPLVLWRFSGRAPERLLVAPPDIRPTDPQVAFHIYHGRFPLAGRTVDGGGASPFARPPPDRDWADALHGFPGLRHKRSARPPPDRDWAEALHGFRWLRHMRAAGTELAQANARALAGDWMDGPGRRIRGAAWEPDVVARRLIAWLMHSPTLLGGTDQTFFHGFLRALAVQARFLRTVAPEMPPGEERLRARVALAFAALCLPVSAAALRQATRNLGGELDRQILPDGGHVSRNPQAIAELLLDLLPLRETYAGRGETAPAALAAAIERMLPMLRFFRHGDGSLARFNGVGAIAQARIDAVLRHDEAGAAPPLRALHAGYERLAMGATLVVADTGAPPPGPAAHAAHAGCLSFEMSSGGRLFIVNAGIDRRGAAEFRLLGRATASHSTAQVNGASSARFSMRGSPREVAVARRDMAGTQSFVASHDGYLARFGLFHERELFLGENGDVLGGIDRFFGLRRSAPKEGRDAVAVRFHVHPDIELSRNDGGKPVLRGPDGDSWTLHSPDVGPSVEDSIFFADAGGPRRTRQVVLAFHASALPEIRWWWRRTAGAG